MPKMSGGCSCGKVRYTADAEPMFVGVCHCTSCQRATGSAFATVIAVPAAALTITGALHTYDAKGDTGSGTHLRFCPNCGSHITGNADVMAGVEMIRAGTLDDRSWVKPSMEIYCDSKNDWAVIGGGVQSAPKMPSPPG